MSATTATTGQQRRQRRIVELGRLLSDEPAEWDSPKNRTARSRQIAIGLFLAGAVATIGWWQPWKSPIETGPQANGTLVYYSVGRADLPITVRERGALASQHETKIICELETVYGQYGTRILTLVPNGTPVKKGDLLVEFDSAPLRDRLATQEVTFEQAKAALASAKVRHENQKTQNETTLAAADLRVKSAEMAQKMYVDGDGGSYRIRLARLNADILEAKNQIAAALATQKIKSNRRKGVEMLFKLGYRGRGDVDEAARDDLQADSALVSATNALATAIAARLKLELYEHPMQVLELQGAIDTARRSLVQVRRDNESALALAQVAEAAAERAMASEEEKLTKYKQQFALCKVLAPHDGLAAHSSERTPWGRLVAEGELVTERFKILSLPDLTAMQAKVGIHESMLDRVKPGQIAEVVIDAFPDTRYRGTVRSVAVMPVQDSSLSSDVKVYDAIVTIDETVEHLKPGMTATVEIKIDRLEDVVCAPIQAVVQEGRATWCFVDGPHGLERRDIETGAVNETHVQIVAGLEADERIVLNPTAVISRADEDNANSRANPDSRQRQPTPAAPSVPGGDPAAIAVRP